MYFLSFSFWFFFFRYNRNFWYLLFFLFYHRLFISPSQLRELIIRLFLLHFIGFLLWLFRDLLLLRLCLRLSIKCPSGHRSIVVWLIELLFLRRVFNYLSLLFFNNFEFIIFLLNSLLLMMRLIRCLLLAHGISVESVILLGGRFFVGVLLELTFLFSIIMIRLLLEGVLVEVNRLHIERRYQIN